MLLVEPVGHPYSCARFCLSKVVDVGILEGHRPDRIVERLDRSSVSREIFYNALNCVSPIRLVRGMEYMVMASDLVPILIRGGV